MNVRKRKFPGDMIVSFMIWLRRAAEMMQSAFCRFLRIIQAKQNMPVILRNGLQKILFTIRKITHQVREKVAAERRNEISCICRFLGTGVQNYGVF